MTTKPRARKLGRSAGLILKSGRRNAANKTRSSPAAMVTRACTSSAGCMPPLKRYLPAVPEQAHRKAAAVT
ncbi:MAG: hypothetical protein BWY87_00943 [Deltaproteobacteria bacterium ADurb.Bin510]|nr:MAG: hypothetical protein BWY87_00943 [Deltaproteobacteria bacterium ADurb.Bin510]